MTDAAQRPDLSIVIPTLGRPIVARTVESVLAAAPPTNIEVIIVGEVADESVLAELERLESENACVRHIRVSFPTGDSSRKKNRGAEESSAEIVAFIDDDVVVAPGWPERILSPFEDETVAMVSGPSLVPDDILLVGRLAGETLSSIAAGYVAHRYLKGDGESRRIKWSGIIGCNMAFRKKVLEAVEWFDPAFWPGEEMLASYRVAELGHGIVFYGDAWLYHYPRASLKGFARQMYGYGATRVRLMRSGLECEPAVLVPALWVLSLLVLGAGAFFSRWVGILLSLDVAAYMCMAAVAALHKFITTKRAGDLLIFFMIPVMHLAYGVAEWIEFLRPGKDLSRPGS